MGDDMDAYGEFVSGPDGENKLGISDARDGRVTVDREDLDWILGFLANLGPRRGSLLESRMNRLRVAATTEGKDEG